MNQIIWNTPPADAVFCECGAHLGKEGSYPKVCHECGRYTDGCPKCDDDMLPVGHGYHQCKTCGHLEYVPAADPAIYEMPLDS